MNDDSYFLFSVIGKKKKKYYPSGCRVGTAQKKLNFHNHSKKVIYYSKKNSLVISALVFY